jgi:hypothetical protein
MPIAPRERWITVVEVFRALGRRPVKAETWSAGDRVAAMWRDETSTDPIKELRPKTAGDGGTHCHAVYPPTWRERIERVVSAISTAEAAQGRLDI